MTILKKNREIVLDTETTGLEHEGGDRIVEIGCVELINHIPTGNTYHVYINPETQKMSPDAVRISGITDDFLKDKPTFGEIADEFLNFVGDGVLVIHNAAFDISFLNSELGRLNKPLFKLEDAIDTLDLAHRKFPGAAANLDALCRRFEIDASSRDEHHGALIDSLLLADVYMELLGGKQSGLAFGSDENTSEAMTIMHDTKQSRQKRTFKPSEEEIAAHNEFLKSMESPIWNKIVI